MKLTIRKWLIAGIVILLTAGWIWRYVTLNAFYDGLYEGKRITYQAGEIVPFDDDRYEMGVSTDGYSIRVDGFAVMELSEFLASISVPEDSVYTYPDKVAVVNAKLSSY